MHGIHKKRSPRELAPELTAVNLRVKMVSPYVPRNSWCSLSSGRWSVSIASLIEDAFAHERLRAKTKDHHPHDLQSHLSAVV